MVRLLASNLVRLFVQESSHEKETFTAWPTVKNGVFNETSCGIQVITTSANVVPTFTSKKKKKT